MEEGVMRSLRARAIVQQHESPACRQLDAV
jgi:hypothetical protein